MILAGVQRVPTVFLRLRISLQELPPLRELRTLPRLSHRSKLVISTNVCGEWVATQKMGWKRAAQAL